MPEPIIFATLVPKTNTATKLKNAAQMTASFGDSTRVDTTVAMLLAASWNPLMKSNASAMRMVTMTTAVVVVTWRALAEAWVGSSALQHDGLKHVSSVFSFVGRGFQHFDQFFLLNKGDWVFLPIEQVR